MAGLGDGISKYFNQLRGFDKHLKSTPSIQIEHRIEVTNDEPTLKRIQRLRTLLTGPGKTEMLKSALDIVIHRTLQRMQGVDSIQMEIGGDMNPLTKIPSTNSNFSTEVAKALQHKRKISTTKVGFASQRRLDKIVVNKRTRSPFVQAWQIMEFGTGRYAAPQIRYNGEFKKDGGNGAWYLGNPNRNPPPLLIQGQEGQHFLFALRKNTQHAKQDVDIVLEFISDTIQRVIEGI
jgi:hypothetical protein